MTASKKRLLFRVLYYAAIAACVLVHIGNAMCYFHASIDDAYISFRYSRNLVEGNGLVFNAGQRVEGFTNLLWTLLIALVMAFGGAPMIWSKLLGLLISSLTVVLVIKGAEWLTRRKDWTTLLPGFWLAINPYFAHWSVVGMETDSFVFFCLLSILLTLQEFRRAKKRKFFLTPLVAWLAALSRPEGMLWTIAPMALFWAYLIWRRELTLQKVLIWLAEFFTLLALFLLARLLYFSDLLPNTYYAKLAYEELHNRGLAHIYYFFTRQGWGFFQLALLMVVGSLYFFTRYTLVLLGFVLLNIFYVYYVNGDWMPNYRFLIPVLPFLFLLFPVTVRRLRWPRWGRRGLPLVALFALWVSFSMVYFSVREESIFVFDWNPHHAKRLRSEWYSPKKWQHQWKRGFYTTLQNVADWVLHNVPDGAQVVTSDIGYPAFLNFRVGIIDIDGLTHRFIAKNRTPEKVAECGQYVLQQNPEFIFLFQNHEEPDPSSPGRVYPELSRMISAAPEFQENYAEVGTLHKYERAYVHLYKRKDFQLKPSPSQFNGRLREAVRYNPRMSHLYNYLINSLLSAGKTTEARTTLRMYVQRFGLAADNRPIWRLANTFQDEQLTDQLFRELRRHKPEYSWSYLQVAALYRRLGRVDKFRSTLTQGLKQFPKDIDLRVWLARLDRGEGNFDEAEKLLQEALALSGQDNVPILNELGYLYQTAGKKQDALRYFLRSLSVQPEQGNISNQVKQLREEIN